MPSTNITSTLSTLITASHILHYHSVLDSMGHVSARNPSNPNTFFIPLQMGPALISSANDFGEYLVEDGSPVDENAKNLPGYAERFIHSEIMKRYPDVNSVVHSHNEDVLPFTVLTGEGGQRTESRLEPIYHMAGFLGDDIPIFDVADVYKKDDAQDLLINTSRLGAALASTFGTNTTHPASPLHTTILQRGHGFVVVGKRIEQAVDYAYYACSNARVQTKALLLNAALGGSQIAYLSPQERKDCRTMNDWITAKPWNQWMREVDPKRNPLYENGIDKD